MMEFVFDSSPWELFAEQLKRGGCVSASYLMTLLEGESEENVEEAFHRLAERDAVLDLSELPRPQITGENGLRLKHEAELVKQGLQPAQLEESDPLRVYLEELAAVPAFGDVCLVAGDLAEASQSGKETDGLRMQLVNLSLSRVVQLAGEYTGWGVLLLDLIQEGSLGLWSALEDYAGNGQDFEAFRDNRIEFALKKAVFLQARADGVGRNLRQALEDYRMADEKLLIDLGRNPTLEEIAEAIHKTPEETAFFAALLDNIRRMEQAKPAAPDPEESEEEEQAVENTAYFQMRQRIADLLSGLPETDAKILTLRFGLEGGLPLSPEETGKKLGLVPAEVVEREAAALSRLRNEK